MGCTFLYYARGISKANVLARFLLAQLHLDSLTGKRSPKAIRSALQQLPKGLNALDSAYKEAMERIESQVRDSQELANQVLSWITCARRPLTTTELQHALAVEIGESELDLENISEVEDIVSVCAGLVTVDKESDIIRLVHYTTQEYFQRTQNFWLPNAQRDIARSCVTYLLFDAFETGFCQTDDEFEARLRFNVLYDYATQNWGHHARVASTEVERLTMNLLENEASLSASSQAMIASSQAMIASRGHVIIHGYSQKAPRHMRGVHVAAYFGLREAITAILNCTQDPDPKNEHGRTPLSFAAEQGHSAVVQLLLAAGGVDPDSKTSRSGPYFGIGTTPLLFAAKKGHSAVVRQLIATKGVNADSKDVWGRTPLSLAAEQGHESVVQLLLVTDGVDVNSEVVDKLGRSPIKGLGMPLGFVPGRTPMSFAAANGHERVVRLLLAKEGIDVDKATEYGRTPLSFAAEQGHELVVRMLLATNNVDINLRDTEDGRTALSFAAENGCEAVVKLLLDQGADPDSKDNTYGRTPLSFAAINGHMVVVKLLLDKSVDINSKDKKYGLTPLSLAAAYGHAEVLKLLLAKDGINPDSNDCDGRTPLSLAAANGHTAAVKLLLAKDDIDPDSNDNDGRTPLLWAAHRGFEGIVKMLLATNNINVDSKDRYGRTPLIGAAVRAQQAVVKLLLKTDGVDPGSKDVFGRTALSEAARRGNVDIVKLLIEKDKENGMEIHVEYGDSAPQPAADPPGRVKCDICLAIIPSGASYHHCGICSNGDFDICEECITSGAFCRNNSHKLVTRTG
jgi:ankyrin repeat protein